METIKTHVDDHQEGTIMCLQCESERNIDIKNYQESVQNRRNGKFIKARCLCGNTFDVFLEFRGHQRVAVNIPGFLTKEQGRTDVIIQSISASGVGFAKSEDMPIDNKDIFIIEFSIENDVSSLIREEIVVKRIIGSFIGASFVNAHIPQEKLDTYLQKANIL